jgi:hypothetical protein
VSGTISGRILNVTEAVRVQKPFEDNHAVLGSVRALPSGETDDLGDGLRGKLAGRVFAVDVDMNDAQTEYVLTSELQNAPNEAGGLAGACGTALKQGMGQRIVGGPDK